MTSTDQVIDLLLERIEDRDKRIKCLEQLVDRLEDEKISAKDDFCRLLQALKCITRGEY